MASAPEPSRPAAAARTAALRLVNAGAGLIASVVISRALLPGGRGLYAIAATVAVLSTVAGTVTFHRALQHAWGRDTDARSLAGAAVVAGIGCGAVSAAAFGTVAQLWPGLVAPTPPRLVWLALAGVPASVATLNVTALLALHGRPHAAALGTLCTGGLHTILLLAGAAAGVLTPAWVLGTGAAAAIAGLPLFLRAVPGGTPLRTARPALVGSLLRWAARYHPGTLAGHLLLRADVLILAAMRGSQQVGLYSLAFAVAETILLITGAVAQAGASAQVDGNDDRYTARLARTSFAVAALAACALALVAHRLVPLLFGQAFAPSVGALLVLLPGVAALAAREPLELAVSRRDRPRVTSHAAGAALVLNIGLNVALVPRWGALGAAMASTAAYAAQLALLASWFLRVSALPPRALLPRITDVTHPLRAVLRPSVARP